MSGGMSHPGLTGESLHPGYGFYNNGEQHWNDQFGGMYTYGGADKTFRRSSSMPVNNINGGYYTGGQSSNPWSNYETDTSSGRLKFNFLFRIG
ncbi:unnamed protein product [Meloidogyne enterolobii]|uniref:Uncharacterized protein n=1 Tax=Meloidogyne enterolobii TaxID=390850 RepID=A0ACB1B8M0_MELEN